MSATITIITGHVGSHRSFHVTNFHDRRRTSVGWKEFPSRSGWYPGLVLVKATQVDLGAFECAPKDDWETNERVHAYAIPGTTLPDKLPALEALVESNAEATARALVASVGRTAKLARVLDAVRAGTWPDVNDAAAEAGAFAHYLLEYTRQALPFDLGLFWEYRGRFARAEDDARESGVSER